MTRILTVITGLYNRVMIPWGHSTWVYNRAMAVEEDTRRTPEPPTAPLTEAQVERMFADMNDVIRAGEEMRRLRAEMIRLFADLGWTQDRIARLTGMSQPAVSKQVTKHKGDRSEERRVGKECGGGRWP